MAGRQLSPEGWLGPFALSRGWLGGDGVRGLSPALRLSGLASEASGAWFSRG